MSQTPELTARAVPRTPDGATSGAPSPAAGGSPGAETPYRRRRDLDAAPDAEGEVAETVGQLDTPAGVALVRVRQLSVPFHVGGRGLVATRIYEVALRTARTLRERQGDARDGWVVVWDNFLVSGHVPDSHLDVHLAAGLRVARMLRDSALAAVAVGDVASPDRGPARPARVVRPQMPSAPGREDASPGHGTWPPAPPRGPSTAPARVRVVRRTYASEGQALHAYLGALGVADHYRYASLALGRAVASLSALTSAEMDAVRAVAEGGRQQVGEGASPEVAR